MKGLRPGSGTTGMPLHLAFESARTGCDLPSKRSILVGVCLALRSRKLLNPTQIKGYLLQKNQLTKLRGSQGW